ncbi:hypothetical protein [Lentzea flava]|uniref:HEXXH motif-containing protein n=1 Tax=Lentzea flava TaxID=103732 RepID=A0ABQ2UBB8_9PSEU|nr:hypothetical protein [Lentzea flava]MCP2196828.1 hypothetical protein [Lentzea flava]GGU15222.1 hypothetical protein GCM10010178_03400 [Lentzea flava]
MIFARAAAQVLIELGIDITAFEHDPANKEYRSRVHDAFFGRPDDHPPDEHVVAEVLRHEQRSGHHLFDMSNLGPSFAQGDIATTLMLTRQTKSALLMFKKIFLRHIDFSNYIERLLVVVPSTHQDAYVHPFRDQRYIVLPYGLVQALEFVNETFLISDLFKQYGDDDGFDSLAMPVVRQVNELRHGVLENARHTPVLFPSLAAALSNLQLLDALCSRTFATLFVVAHEAVHAEERHDVLFDPLNDAHPAAATVRMFVEGWSVSPGTALELSTDERAYFLFDPVGAWTNMSAAIATYFLMLGKARYRDKEKLAVVGARVRNLSDHHLGSGNAATFGVGGVMIAEIEKLFDKWLGAERPKPSDDYKAWWREYLYLGPKVQRYLMTKIATAIQEKKFPTPMSTALAKDRPLHDPFELHREPPSLTKVDDALAVLTQKLDQLRPSTGSPIEERAAFAAGLDGVSKLAAGLGQWDVAITWSAEAVQLLRVLAAEDPQRLTDMLGLALIGYSAVLNMSVQDPKEKQCRQTEIVRTTLEELRTDITKGMMLIAERFRAEFRIEERLSTCAEAIEIFRELSAKHGSTDDLRNLIGALGNYAGVLLDDHRHDEAEAAAEEVVQRCREAISDISFLPDLARSLYTAAFLMAKRKDGTRKAEAVAALKESGALYVRLVLSSQGDHLGVLTEVIKLLEELGEPEAAARFIRAVKSR